jgi:hypothetical protein
MGGGAWCLVRGAWCVLPGALFPPGKWRCRARAPPCDAVRKALEHFMLESPLSTRLPFVLCPTHFFPQRSAHTHTHTYGWYVCTVTYSCTGTFVWRAVQLANPADRFPGVSWGLFNAFPYLLPCLLGACLNCAAFAVVLLGMGRGPSRADGAVAPAPAAALAASPVSGSKVRATRSSWKACPRSRALGASACSPCRGCRSLEGV